MLNLLRGIGLTLLGAVIAITFPIWGTIWVAHELGKDFGFMVLRPWLSSQKRRDQ